MQLPSHRNRSAPSRPPQPVSGSMLFCSRRPAFDSVDDYQRSGAAGAPFTAVQIAAAGRDGAASPTPRAPSAVTAVGVST